MGFASVCLISALLRLRVGDVVIVIGRVGAHIVTIARSIGVVGTIAPSDRVVASRGLAAKPDACVENTPSSLTSA